MEDLTEKEQLEKFREWWSENGNFVIAGVVLGIAIMVGISQWKSKTVEAQAAASMQFEALMAEVDDGDLEAAEVIATDLHDNFSSSVYAAQARLAMARLYMDKGRDQDAADSLGGMLDDDPDNEMQQVARLRLAKVLLYQSKPQDVVDLLQNRTDTAFVGRFSEMLGDAYVALGRIEDAADAYALAMSDEQRLPTVDQSLLQWKIVDLPDASEAEAEEAVDETAATNHEEGADETAAASDAADEGTQ